MFYDCRSKEVSSVQLSNIVVPKRPIRTMKKVNYNEDPG